MSQPNTRLLVRCCYLGMVVQAAIINLTPILFIPLRQQFGLSFEQIGRLVLINFTTQVTFDLVCGPLVDRLGVKRFAVAAPLLAMVGLWLFAGLPWLMRDPYHGLVIGTIVFSLAGGILEMLLSPIINAVPSDQKAQDMSLLHSFYAWGQLTVVLVTALALYFFEARHWPWIVLAWSLLPLVNVAGFIMVQIPPLVEEHKRQRLRQLIRQPFYWGAVLAMGLSGASEIAIGQWTSAFAEKGLGLPKLMGDLGGFALFAAALGIGRVWFGLYGGKVCLYRYLIAGSWLSVAVYLVASLSPWPWLALTGCVLAGLGVSLLWPGVLTVTAGRFPLAGASMFALLSAAGDLGAAVAPWQVGWLADRAAGLQGWLAGQWGLTLTAEQLGLRAGLLLATIFPLTMVGVLYWLRAAAARPVAVAPPRATPAQVGQP